MLLNGAYMRAWIALLAINWAHEAQHTKTNG
jgi:hypothetical protein